MNLENVKTVHDVLIKCIDISTDIEKAALSLAASEYCPSGAPCEDRRSCIECWKHWLESEVSTNDHA